MPGNDRHLPGGGTRRGAGAGEVVVEIGNARPRGRFSVGVDIVPAERGRKVHDVRAGIEALAGEVGAVAAEGFVVVIARIAPKRPAVGIAHRRVCVVGKQGHGITSFHRMTRGKKWLLHSGAGWGIVSTMTC